jgi:hypothetical protein
MKIGEKEIDDYETEPEKKVSRPVHSYIYTLFFLFDICWKATRQGTSKNLVQYINNYILFDHFISLYINIAYCKLFKYMARQIEIRNETKRSWTRHFVFLFVCLYISFPSLWIYVMAILILCKHF